MRRNNKFSQYQTATLLLAVVGIGQIAGCSQTQKKMHLSQWLPSADASSDTGKGLDETAILALDNDNTHDPFSEVVAPDPTSVSSEHSDSFQQVSATSESTAADDFFSHSPHEPILKTLAPGEELADELARSNGIVLVDFYADWCGPCRRQGQILHESEDVARSSNARIVKVDVERHRALARQYDVGSLPTLIAFKNGKIVDRRKGLTDQKQLAAVFRK